MKVDQAKVTEARQRAEQGLTSAERLALAADLLSGVLERIEPFDDPALCVAQGNLEAAANAMQSGLDLLEDILDDDDLPPAKVEG